MDLEVGRSTFALPMNLNNGIDATDHTSTPRPNIEHDGEMVPIFGVSALPPLEGHPNTDFAHTQILEATKAKTPLIGVRQDEPSTHTVAVRSSIPESPASFLFKLLGQQEEENPIQSETIHGGDAKTPTERVEEDSITEPVEECDPNQSDIFDSAMDDSEDESGADERGNPVCAQPPDLSETSNGDNRKLARNLTDG